jgi:acyl-CoA dehydrogenase
MDISYHSEDDIFRDKVRLFISEALTAELRIAGQATTGVYTDIAASREWHRRLYRRGWAAPVWPREHGGAGWTTRQRLIFEHECARAGAPILFAGGIRNVGPLLIAMGTQDQRDRYLQAILNADDLWCQGFSETGAGSDLVALKLHARRDGTHYVLNGAKLWTTGAHESNRMFALVRTSSDGKPQQGITFLLIDMPTPGLTVRPIISMSGEHEFNEVLFDNVRVPVENRVGDENDGWTVARQLMRFARSSNTTSALVRRAMLAATRVQIAHDIRDAAILMQRAQLEAELDALEALELRLMDGAQATSDTTASMLKVLATDLHQRVATFALGLSGDSAIPFTGANAGGPLIMRKYLNVRAASIYSGTNETQRNVLAGQIIGRL